MMPPVGFLPSAGGIMFLHKDKEMMMTGVAVGGPRDGVKLSAGSSWDGRVRLRPPKNEQEMPSSKIIFHPGYYKWYPKYDSWVWISDK